MDDLFAMKRELRRDDFSAMPFPKASGYHSKTIAYSIWHIFRIEDIATDNPKRRYRNAKRQLQSVGIGTKSQQALAAQREETKIERKRFGQEQREAENSVGLI